MRVIVCSIVLIALAGCAPRDRAQLTKEVLDADPAFHAVLERRDDYASRLETAERELALKRATIQRNIRKLREELIESERAVRKKKEQLRTLIEPDRRGLEMDLDMALTELRAKGTHRASIGRAISRLRKAVKQAGEVWSEAERNRQDAQLQDMVRDAQRLDKEVAALKQHIRLLKLKLALTAL